MPAIDAIILGIIQGITEFLPISSSGHLLIAREVLHMPLAGSLSMDIFLNTATFLAVLWCFRGEIKRIVIDLLTEGWSARSRHLVTYLIIGTIPAALVGYFYAEEIETSFRTIQAVAWALIIGSLIMLLADWANKKFGNKGGLSATKSILIGVFQTLALVPGMSRSGMSISGGLLSKLSREEAIKFAFLLYIPISFGAALKAFLDLRSQGDSIIYFLNFSSILSFLLALIVGILVLKFLINFLSRNTFTPFIIYRIIVAILLLTFI